MAIGSITSFPINTVLEFATSADFGLCPQLSGSISTIANANTNYPASEKAIRLAINEINPSVAHENIGSGYGLFATLSAPTAYFNTVVPVGSYITGFVSGDTLYLSGFSASGSSPITGSPAVSGLTSTLSVQGGRYQYSDTIQASAIPTTGFTIAYAVQDDVIGKMFIKCTTPFEQNSSLYSIGLSGDQQRYVQSFDAPDTAGLVTGWTYGLGITGEYDWLSQDSEIKIFRNGSQCASGEVGISIFYDHVVWAPTYGYAFLSNTQRFDMSNETASIRVPTITNLDARGVTSFNSYIYLGGGYYSSSVQNQINRYETKNDTYGLLDRGDLTVARDSSTSYASAIKAYFFGGNDNLGNALLTIDNIQFSNDTANAVNNVNHISARLAAGAGGDSTYAYIGAGADPSSVPKHSIEKMAFASDTSISSLAAIFNTQQWWTKPFNIAGKVIFCPGRNNTSATGNTNEAEELTISSDTSTAISNFNIIATSTHGVMQDNINGYIYGGQQEPLLGFNTTRIEKWTFATYTSSVLNGQCPTSFVTQNTASV